MTSHLKHQPAKKLGILGGGQLGRMSAMAAAKLGIKTHIYTPDQDSPASQVSAKTYIGNYDNYNLLAEFASSVDVISYEFENIPVNTIKFLKNYKAVYPDESLLEVAQHRWNEKEFLNNCNIPTTKWAKATCPLDVKHALEEWGVTSCILKTTMLGYDGKGQIKIDTETNSNAIEIIENSWKNLKCNEAIVEQLVDFEHEISVIAARDFHGKTIYYPPTLNYHHNHILSKSIAPAPLDQNTLETAVRITLQLIEKINLIGVIALEMFVTKSGQILANEIAPRTHNSGHWTIDACSTSQFENHVRAVCGHPLGHPLPHSSAIMHNIIGDDIFTLDRYWTMKGANIHLYGKSPPAPGRKMGHVTIIT